MGRVADRRDFDVPTRLRLMEGDLDRLEELLGAVDRKMDRILGSVMALLITVIASMTVLLLTGR